MVFKPLGQHGASFVELLMVMGTIMILSATALIFYSGQLHKAHSIVLVHDLKRFSGHVQTTFLADKSILFEQGSIITTQAPIKGFIPYKDVVMTIKELDKEKPYGDNPFIVAAVLKKSSASINMKTHTIMDLSEFEYEDFQNKLLDLLSFFFTSVGITALVTTTVISIIAIVALRK
ncbi:MAG: hypothetical protein GY707_06070 [Desulfobacteraceae bacterium]|nr:hypothetical protein [Desulfobacteraceae bacterium]